MDSCRWTDIEGWEQARRTNGSMASSKVLALLIVAGVALATNPDDENFRNFLRRDYER